MGHHSKFEWPSPNFARSVRLVRKLCIQFWSPPDIPNWSNYWSNLRRGTQPKAFLKPKYITSVVRQDLPCLKPCCVMLITDLESTNRVRAASKMCSVTFEHVLVRLAGWRFSGLNRATLYKLAIRWLLTNPFGNLECRENWKMFVRREADFFSQFLKKGLPSGPGNSYFCRDWKILLTLFQASWTFSILAFSALLWRTTSGS